MASPGVRKVLVFPVAPAGTIHEYLLLREVAALGGRWHGVTGTVRPDETPDEAAVRELGEGIRLTPTRLAAVALTHTSPAERRRGRSSSRGGPVIEHVFLALLGAKVDPTIDTARHDAWDWYTFEEAVRWLQEPENKDALRRCERLFDPEAHRGR